MAKHTRRRKTLAERFWAKVDTSGECWPWTASLTKAGYGQLSSPGGDGPPLLAHRVSWELHNGPIPEGIFVCHDCPGGDNPACVRPTHLFLGTAEDNSRDCVWKGRWASTVRRDSRPRGEQHPMHLHPERLPHGDEHWTRREPERVRRGADAPGAIITLDIARAIRQRYAAGGISGTALAAEYGIKQPTVSAIVHRRIWKDDGGDSQCPLTSVETSKPPFPYSEGS